MRYYFFLIFTYCCLFSNSQEINSLEFVVEDNDTIYLSELPEIEIFEFSSIDDRVKYYKLKRRVYKTYPYALIVKKKLKEIEKSLDTIPKRYKKRKYTKMITNWLKKEYSQEIKKLSMNDGKILVKLIFRETNLSAYNIIKIHRGNINAFLWQNVARLWDNNLKQEYDPVNVREDMFIEHIILQAKLMGKF